MIELIIVLLMCHLVGDYVIQTRFIAESKGHNWYHLLVHCVLYVLPFYLYFGLTWQLGIIFMVHVIVDPLKARWRKITYWQDQVLHYLVCLVYFI